MHIFIDESGVFQRSDRQRHAISCVGAVIVPGRHLANVESEFRELVASWPKEGGETKGRLLNEHHFAQLCELLAPKHLLFEVSVMDMNSPTEAEVLYHRQKQAEGMTIHLTEEHHPNLVREVKRLKHELEQMPPQLYAQTVTLTHVAWRALEHGMLYYCQRFPGELARFAWVIDAKAKGNITRYEEWWRINVKPMLQSRSLREPLAMLKGADCSAYRRSFPSMPVPDYLRDHVRNPQELVSDLTAVFDREMTFGNSLDHVGLQLADILTNGIRRALTGRLRREGWQPIRKLMINHKKGAVRFITLGSSSAIEDQQFASVGLQLARGGRSMILERAKRVRPYG